MICTNFVFWQVWGVRFNIWQKLFKTESQKYPNKEFFLPNLKFLLLHKILHLDIFERVHVKYDNSFSKLHLKDTQLRYFYSQVLRFFVLYKTLHIDKLEDADFKHDNNLFKLQLKKGPNMTLSMSNLQFFVFQET